MCPPLAGRVLAVIWQDGMLRDGRRGVAQPNLSSLIV